VTSNWSYSYPQKILVENRVLLVPTVYLAVFGSGDEPSNVDALIILWRWAPQQCYAQKMQQGGVFASPLRP
jgi:hypothetical protein